MDNSLKVMRARKDLTQAELADAVRVSRQTVNAIEVGRYDPSLSLAFTLADYFDCRIEDLFHPDNEITSDE